jgi:hypothetical protein
MPFNVREPERAHANRSCAPIHGSRPHRTLKEGGLAAALLTPQPRSGDDRERSHHVVVLVFEDVAVVDVGLWRGHACR